MTDPQASVTIQVRGVHKSFGSGANRIEVLKDINLDCRRGEILMIVGPSGCGKTTLLTCMVGTLGIDSGEIVVLGESLQKMSPNQIVDFRRRHVGFIFQQFHLIPTLTLTENVSVPLTLNFFPEMEAFAQAQRMLTQVGLGEKVEQRPPQLSGGQQQRVAIARALVHDPAIVICDEPTSSLDGKTGLAVVELLKDIAKSQERSVVIVTHDSRIFGFADRIVEMEDGRVKQIYDDPLEYKKKMV